MGGETDRRPPPMKAARRLLLCQGRSGEWVGGGRFGGVMLIGGSFRTGLVGQVPNLLLAGPLVPQHPGGCLLYAKPRTSDKRTSPFNPGSPGGTRGGPAAPRAGAARRGLPSRSRRSPVPDASAPPAPRCARPPRPAAGR